MIYWCNLPYLTITSDVEPCVTVRTIFASDTKEEKKDKKTFPYFNKRRILFDVNYLGSQYAILIEKGFKWDGSSCPGLHHIPTLLVASCVHDKLCNHHELVDYDRQLSSMIFREIGITSGTNKIFMHLAYHCVDNFQKLFGKDLNGENWKNHK